MAADGLLFAYTDPGPVSLEEFNDWYDNEHGPARLTVPGISSARRYRALDGQAPPWLALYEMVEGTTGSAEYKALAASASPREKLVLSRIALDRREYQQVSSDGPKLDDPAPAVMTVSISVPSALEEDMAAWYADEHIPMLLEVPGWLRIRRYRLTSGTAPAWLSLHEIKGPEVFDEPAYQAASSTPWRNRIVGSATARERRVFGLHASYGLLRGRTRSVECGRFPAAASVPPSAQIRTGKSPIRPALPSIG